MVYFYQARGFSLAECYYLSVTNPYQGLMVGEPLAAPFALPATAAWLALPANALLQGTTNLSLQIVAADPNHPVSQVDLFVDGTFLLTLTNLPPQPGNVLHVTLNGQSVAFTVPADANLNSVAAGLADTLNTSANSNATEILALAAGDRIELHSLDPYKPGSLISLTANSAVGQASALTTFIQASGTNFLDTIAYGLRGFTVTNAPLVGDYLQMVVTKVSGVSITNAVTNTIAGTTVSSLVFDLMSVLNADSRLQGPDGVVAQDWFNGDAYLDQPLATFNLCALSPGLDASQILSTLSASTNLDVTPGDSQPLNDYLSDLQPRAHLYVTAGTTHLALTFGFDTTAQADGVHELTAVIYEGSNVRTQRRVAQSVRIQNTALSAVFSTPFSGSNVAVEATLPFTVTANTSAVASIEWFSTGGSLGVVTGQSNATFAVAGQNLGLGLHPFYAMVTAAGGARYRTETRWIRLVGAEAPFPLRLTNLWPLILSWPATPGRTYEILAAANLDAAFQAVASVTPTNSWGNWAQSNPPPSELFYRVRTQY